MTMPHLMNCAHSNNGWCLECVKELYDEKTKHESPTQKAKAVFGCAKNTIRLRSGRYFDFADPKPDQFTLADIAGALAKICRFGGQINSFYSVAEHSIHCAEVARQDGLPIAMQRAAFLHDAAEAFCGIVVRPLKIMLKDYAEIENRVESVIGDKFNVDFIEHDAVIREIDNAMLIAERRTMFSPDAVTWFGEKEVRQLQINFQLWGPRMAEITFTTHARMLGISEDE